MNRNGNGEKIFRVNRKKYAIRNILAGVNDFLNGDFTRITQIRYNLDRLALLINIPRSMYGFLTFRKLLVRHIEQCLDHGVIDAPDSLKTILFLVFSLLSLTHIDKTRKLYRTILAYETKNRIEYCDMDNRIPALGNIQICAQYHPTGRYCADIFSVVRRKERIIICFSIFLKN
ncbi:MAG: hypothetical protein JW904_03070 [Spirochaetales bacterium]|nr:hypothetical protein [Spirochaetales bacterium]